MGCDIHFYVEKKAEGKWINSQKVAIEHDDDTIPDVPYEDRIYSGRNYSLFGILANVRNGSDFAGCDTGNAFIPISEPKGLPDDVSEEVKAISDGWEPDCPSHSYHTLRDLLDYDWTQMATQRGWVTAQGYFDYINQSSYNENEAPSEYCGGAFGKDIRHIDAMVMESEVEAVSSQHENYHNKRDAVAKELKDTYCLLEWKLPYYKTCRRFLSDTIPQLLRLGSPEDVRIVFWFAN